MNYWGAIYIPVVVAMAMQQNVVAALRGGPMALLAAAGSVAACGCLISAINRAEVKLHPGPPDEGQSGRRAMREILEKAARENGLVAAFAVVGLVNAGVGVPLAQADVGPRAGLGDRHPHRPRDGLCGGEAVSGGTKGLADIALFGGVGLMGGNMLRDFAIVATAFEVHPEEARRAGWIGLARVAARHGRAIPRRRGRGGRSATRTP